jgi:anion-transporting  ArsA/GET3 family ATPase
MDPAAYFRRSAVLVVAGKGGVGKSTVTGVLAAAAARTGLRVLAVELEGRTELPRALGVVGELDGEERLAIEDPSGGSVTVLRLRPDDALVEWLSTHGLRAVVRRLRNSGALEVVAFAIPGIREVLILGKLKSLERGGRYDLVVLDAPATGHALTLLTSASGLANAARGGPVRRIAEEVRELLSDPARCRVILVTLPRELAVDETVEAAFEVEERAGVTLGEVIVNLYRAPLRTLDEPLGPEADALDDALVEAIEAARAFELARERAGAAEVERLRTGLPLPLILLPALDGARVGRDQLEVLADELLHGVAELAVDG